MGWFAGLRPVVVLGALGWVVRDGALQDAEAGAQAWRVAVGEDLGLGFKQ